MKNFIIYTVIVILFISIISRSSEDCTHCKELHESIRYARSINELNYIMNQRINCECK